MSDKEPEKKKAKRGFAAHPENINLGGRPKGSRNKSTLIRAQLQLDGTTEQAAEFLAAVMENNTTKLGLKDDDVVPMALRLAAADKILNKAIANEKDKESPVEEAPQKKAEVKRFSPRAV